MTVNSKTHVSELCLREGFLGPAIGKSMRMDSLFGGDQILAAVGVVKVLRRMLVWFLQG